MKARADFTLAGIVFLLTVAFSVVSHLMDVAAIGPEGSSIGLSHLNSFFQNKFPLNMFYYRITEYLGGVVILVAGLFALAGLIQWIRRKNILKVDYQILAMGIILLLIFLLYLLFEVVIVNYRPVIMPGAEGLEASFPSSHTMMVCVVMGSAAMVLSDYICSHSFLVFLEILCILVIVAMIVGRILSGAHWFSDIVSGLGISGSILLAYAGALAKIRQ